MTAARKFVACCILLVPVLAASAEQQTPVASSNPVASQSLDELSATIDRPLFSPSRRPPAPPPPPPVQAAAPPAPPPAPPNLLLLGVVMDGEGARAILRGGAENKLLRAQIGDDIDGWKISQIDGRKVVLSSLDGRFATFGLFSDEQKKQEAARPMLGGAQNTPRQTQAQQTSTEAATPQSGQPRKRRRSRE
jgi:hypothetical protein